MLYEKFDIKEKSLVGLSTTRVAEEFLNKLFCMYILLIYNYKIKKNRFYY